MTTEPLFGGAVSIAAAANAMSEAEAPTLWRRIANRQKSLAPA